MVEHIVCSNFCICVWRASFCTVLSCSNSILILSICYVSVSYKSAFRSQAFVSCKSSSKDQSEIILVFWNCLQWYARQITLLYIKEWAKNLIICGTQKKNLNDSLFLFVICTISRIIASWPFPWLVYLSTWDNSVSSDICQAADSPGKFAVCLSSGWSH